MKELGSRAEERVSNFWDFHILTATVSTLRRFVFVLFFEEGFFAFSDDSE